MGVVAEAEVGMECEGAGAREREQDREKRSKPGVERRSAASITSLVADCPLMADCRRSSGAAAAASDGGSRDIRSRHARVHAYTTYRRTRAHERVRRHMFSPRKPRDSDRRE